MSAPVAIPETDILKPRWDKYGPHPYDQPDDGWDSAHEIDHVIPTHCCYCGMQCGMNLLVEKNRVVGMEPREDFPVNLGKLCPKGVTAYLQVHHPDRLTHPLIKENGAFRPASWEEALDLIERKFKEIQAKHGKDAVAVTGGASLTTERAYLIGKFARLGIGTKFVDYNGRLCMVAAAGANMKAFGVDRVASPWSDIPLSDVILCAGINVAECFPIQTRYLWEAKDKGAKLIVVDPRKTATARVADLHLQIRSGTDIALTNAILRILIEENLVNPAFIAERTNDYEAAVAAAMEVTVEDAATLCGVKADDIRRAALWYGHAKNAMVLHARGIEHHSKGVHNVLSYINLVLATGQIGRPGAGYGTVTGQGNGQGGREHGQKAEQLPGQRSITDPAAREHVAKVWGCSPDDLPGPGVSIYEQVDKILEGEIHGLISFCNNVAVSLPNQNRVRKAYTDLDFYVNVDFFLSETGRYADVVLPCAVWAEDEGTITNGEGRVIKINKAVDPPGEAKTDWAIMAAVAKRMGTERYFPFNEPREIFDELRKASAGGKADYAGITYEKIEANNGIFWPCPTEDHPGTPRLFEESFYHPDGRAVFHGIRYQTANEIPDAEYPFLLTTGRVVYHFLSGNQTRRIGFLRDQCPEPYVEMHPSSAKTLGIANSDLVWVSSRRGEIQLPARVVNTIRPDTLFIPYHWGDRQSVNLLTNDTLDPYAKIPEFKACAARVSRTQGGPCEGILAPDVSVGVLNATPETTGDPAKPDGGAS